MESEIIVFVEIKMWCFYGDEFWKLLSFVIKLVV